MATETTHKATTDFKVGQYVTNRWKIVSVCPKTIVVIALGNNMRNVRLDLLKGWKGYDENGAMIFRLNKSEVRSLKWVTPRS